MNIFEEIKKKTNIQDIERLYPSIEFNSSRAAISPFNPSEKTPSFIYCPDRNIVSCFSTQRLGMDIIKFVAEYERYSMTDAATFINEKLDLGLKITADPNTELYKIQQSIITRAKKNINEEVVDYLMERGLTKQSIEQFDIGYLNERIFFPLKNIHGKVIGFNSRQFKDNGPKYLHSKESNIFVKKEYCANLDKAIKLTKAYVVITEGLIDCIQAYQRGIPAVSCLSTNLTEKQIKTLMGYFNSIVLAFDSDEAGTRATIKAYKEIRKLNPFIEISVMDFKPYKDLGEAIIEEDIFKFQLPFYKWYAGRNKIEHTDFLKLLAAEKSSINRRIGAQQIARRLGYQEDDILKDVELVKVGASVSDRRTKKFKF